MNGSGLSLGDTVVVTEGYWDSDYHGLTGTVEESPHGPLIGVVDRDGDVKVRFPSGDYGYVKADHLRPIRPADAPTIDPVTVKAIALRAAYWTALGDNARAAKVPSAESLAAWVVVAGGAS